MVNIEQPYKNGVAVTPSDATIIAPTQGLYIGGAGNVTVRMAQSGANVTFTAPPVGTILRITVDRVLSTGTTATAMVALYT